MTANVKRMATDIETTPNTCHQMRKRKINRTQKCEGDLCVQGKLCVQNYPKYLPMPYRFFRTIPPHMYYLHFTDVGSEPQRRKGTRPKSSS